ncbi:hypothetical protein BD779DRAFT_1064699 [Infundibulicybe gibba]|nr:hypothetical protein BD779DRAFT_1064699 [Infundibulicybe gibba]
MAPLVPVVKGVITRHGKGLHYVNINLKTVSAALEELRTKFSKSPRFFTEPLDNLYNGSGFSGRVHCEAALATRIFNNSKPTAIQYDKTAIGTSKRCCPTCSELLEALSSKLKKPTIRTIGSHRTSTPYALPDDLSSDLVDHMLEESEKKLMIRLRDLCLIQLHSHQDSIGGDSPPSPRSPDSDPLSGDEMILSPVEDD